MNITIINHGVINYHYKKPNNQQLKRDDVAKRFTKLCNNINTIQELIVNGKKDEAIKLIDDVQKIQYEAMELFEEEVKNDIISEEVYLTTVKGFKFIYDLMNEYKQQII
jgi:ribosomal protein L25 (general stress protein Ctc)